MKQKLLLCTITLFLSVLFLSCKEKHNYQEEIQGKWLCQEVNNFIVPTSEAFVVQFSSDMSMIKATGHTFSADSSLWIESRLNYDIEENEILVSGQNSIGEQVNEKYVIRISTDTKLLFEQGTNSYILYRINDNILENLVGNWEGFVVRNVDTISLDMQFSTTGELLLKENDVTTISGTYKVYGNLLTVNFTPVNKTDYSAYSNWLVNFEDGNENKMSLIQYFPIAGTHDLSVLKYSLERVN